MNLRLVLLQLCLRLPIIPKCSIYYGVISRSSKFKSMCIQVGLLGFFITVWITPVPSVSIRSLADKGQDCSSSTHKSPPKKPKSASVMEESCSSRLKCTRIKYKNKMQAINYTAYSSFVPKIGKCILTFCFTEEKKKKTKTYKY